jgi:transcriptional regulator with XRE-family HTH domain
MREKNLTQSQLAKFLGVSRVRVTQMLNLLKLPIEQQNYILEHGKEKFITERSLRKLVALAKQRGKDR